jgi:hypothetical protein
MNPFGGIGPLVIGNLVVVPVVGRSAESGSFFSEEEMLYLNFHYLKKNNLYESEL